MAQSNPYEPPRVPFSGKNHLVNKARRLLERRDEPITLLRFLGDQWRLRVLVAIAFAILCAVAWRIGNLYLVVGLASFWAGRTARDLQWFRTLAREWDSTKELLDWEKIKSLAG